MKGGQRNKKPLKFGTQVFNSLFEAGKYLKINPSCLRWSAEHNGKYKGTVCEYADKTEQPTLFDTTNVPSEVVKKKKTIPNRRGVRVESATKKFRSIKEAARYLHEEPHILCHRLRTRGQFVKDGEVYKAIDPARKLRPYTKTMPKHKKQLEMPVMKSEPIIPETVSGKSIARNILKEHLNKYIQNNQFNVAKDIIDVIESIKD